MLYLPREGMEKVLGLKKQVAQFSYQRITEDLKITRERLKEWGSVSAVLLLLSLKSECACSGVNDMIFWHCTVHKHWEGNNDMTRALLDGKVLNWSLCKEKKIHYFFNMATWE